MSIYDKYEMVVGLEIHVQLKTKTKAYSSDDASYGGAPNTHISPVSLGHPGTLPRVNKRQIEFAVRLGHALGCDIRKDNFFARKNYFYADLPKGYQITQDTTPICTGGFVEVEVDTLEQFGEVVELDVDIILLDNMSIEMMQEAVAIRNASSHSPLLEASGGVNAKTVRSIAETGVDRIAIGALTHQVKWLDVGLDVRQ